MLSLEVSKVGLPGVSYGELGYIICSLWINRGITKIDEADMGDVGIYCKERCCQDKSSMVEMMPMHFNSRCIFCEKLSVLIDIVKCQLISDSG